ncbi:acetylesterase [Floricoccus penangensis]|uniref:Acetylesterase n=1 Tax=Floricoccus penangensis TaxID=1859475 RepID=A0A9Q5NYM8_9LACT|nr:alpha/beta hydrolase family protein [Floricoccus penangensis]OFI45733.1 acetylesterase [Floricoccus penangensis]
MALFKISYFSNSLAKEMEMEVILPQKTENTPDWSQDLLSDLPVLYLLHGMGGNENNWLRRTRFERLIRNTALAVVIPNGDLSWYNNTTYGLKYFDALAIDLPKIVHEFFPQISQNPDKNFIAGASMGGYGAFKTALATKQFGYAASLSGALLGIENKELRTFRDAEYWHGVFGDQFENPKNNLLELAQRKIKNIDEIPKLFAWCGKEDFLFEDNENLVNDFKNIGINIDYRVNEGTHDWYYWDQQIETVLEWLPIDYVKEERLS